MSDSELSDPPPSLHDYENEEAELPAPIPSLSLRGRHQYSLPTTTSILFSKNLFSRSNEQFMEVLQSETLICCICIKEFSCEVKCRQMDMKIEGKRKEQHRGCKPID
jgi:hypothetical protein